jgi:splicing factor 3A subunit 2
MVDRQNRVGVKFGGGGVSSGQQTERERKERLRRLALESIDLAKDPYLVRNHLGSYECKLCLTLHRDENNYLSHTQGKKHQQGLARRAHLDQLKQERENQTNQGGNHLGIQKNHVIQQQQNTKVKIGRPGYQVYKSRHPTTNQRCLTFEIYYIDIVENIQPRYRFMSAYEQKIDLPPNRFYQYLLIAAEPYETIAFKIPNEPIDKNDEEKFVTYWDHDTKKFTITLHYM